VAWVNRLIRRGDESPYERGSSGLDTRLTWITVPDLVRLLRGAVIALPRRDATIVYTGQPGDTATGTVPAKPAKLGPTPRQHHDHDYMRRIIFR
jgi:hypothetical protein